MIRNILKCIRTSKNLWAVLELYLHRDRKRLIHFYNSPGLILNWTLYRAVRDTLARDWTVAQGQNSYEFTRDGMKIFGDIHYTPFILAEPFEDHYQADYRDKTILDAGGYTGETMVLFWRYGAKKVIVYEPVPEFLNYIQLNAKMNNINAEIHNEGLGPADGETLVSYHSLDSGFGLAKEGNKSIPIKLKNVRDALIACKADIAKFDCEGCENCLLDLDHEALIQVPYYIIECHFNEEKITEKFLNEGFNIARKIPKSNRNIAVIHFRYGL